MFLLFDWRHEKFLVIYDVTVYGRIEIAYTDPGGDVFYRFCANSVRAANNRDRALYHHTTIRVVSLIVFNISENSYFPYIYIFYIIYKNTAIQRLYHSAIKIIVKNSLYVFPLENGRVHVRHT